MDEKKVNVTGNEPIIGQEKFYHVITVAMGDKGNTKIKSQLMKDDPFLLLNILHDIVKMVIIRVGNKQQKTIGGILGRKNFKRGLSNFLKK